jgi:hypothetical protein
MSKLRARAASNRAQGGGARVPDWPQVARIPPPLNGKRLDGACLSTADRVCLSTNHNKMRDKMLRAISRPAVVMMERYLPDPFIFVLLLTIIAAAAAMIFRGRQARLPSCRCGATGSGGF